MGSHTEEHQFVPSRRTVLRAGGALGLAAALTTLDWSHLTPAEQALASPGGAVKLNVLFIGAHPDDEAGTLGTFGQWNEFSDMQVGVITVTRGEGGGNAVGLEEGPPLGLLREAEERTAVGYAGIEHVYNLDGLDFYYTASAPLSSDVWGGEAVLNRIVRVIRATRPEVIVTMNPSAVEGNHGNHQQAAMYAVEAYAAAGDPARFPEHAAEGFDPWQPSRILRSGANGRGNTGPDGVATGYTPTVASDVVFGCWNGTMSEAFGVRWSELNDKAKWSYVTQGWALRAPSPTDPQRISNTWLTVIHSRSPIVDPTSGNEAALRGAALPIEGGLPHGTLIDLRPGHFEAVPGQAVPVSVTITAPSGTRLRAGSLALAVPSGWSTDGPHPVSALRAGTSEQVAFAVTAPADATVGSNVRVEATYSVGAADGTTFAQLRVAGAVEASIKPLEEIQQFRDWTRSLNVKHLDVLVPELMSMGSGRTRDLEIVIENFSEAPASGSIAVKLPEGFAANPATLDYSNLAGGATTSLTLELTNTDVTLPTANRAPNNGAYPVRITATSAAGTATRNVILNLVPTYAVQRASVSPTMDGVRSPDEYPGEPIDISTLWDGRAPDGPADVSGATWITHDDENFYLFISVVDDIRGTILPAADNKRQRRTDAVEIYFDPRGTAPNTARTFIGGIMPSMDSMTGAPGVGRDRDNWQGPADVTAPGMEVKVAMAETEADYTGYDLEVKIPFAVLPDNVDPTQVGFNVVIDDSDTQDKSAQSRTAWSTFPGMRADPWRWGLLTVPGLTDLGSAPKDAILPDTAARSVESPQSILQASGDQVPLGGGAPLRSDIRIRSLSRGAGAVDVRLVALDEGTARVYVWDGSQILGHVVRDLRRGASTVTVPMDTESSESQVVAVSFESGGRVSAASAEVGS